MLNQDKIAFNSRSILYLIPMRIFTFIVFILFTTQVVKAQIIDTVAIYSTSMSKEIGCVVIKPDNYDDEDLRFPVVYLLHGYSDSYLYWEEEILKNKKVANELQMILVCPDGGYNSWYFDSPIDSTSRYETHISKEVVKYIDNNYKTIPDRNNRAITGLSMGGHGAFYIAMRNSAIFGAVGSTSGGVDITAFKTKWEIANKIGDTIKHKDNWKNMTIINMIDKYPIQTLSIIFDCGTDDFFYDVNKNLHAKMLDLGIPHDYIERPGGHTNDYWQHSIDYQLLYFKKFFEKHNETKVSCKD